MSFNTKSMSDANYTGLLNASGVKIEVSEIELKVDKEGQTDGRLVSAGILCT